MDAKSTGWVIFIAAIGMMCTLLAADIANLKQWHEALTPAFIGVLLAHIGVVIAAFVGGKLIPTDRDSNLRERSTDK